MSKWTRLALVCLLSLIGISLRHQHVFASQVAPHVFDFTEASSNPILVPGADGAWDADSVRFPHVIYHDSIFHMFYGTFQDFDTPVAIGYATSEDGITWTKYDANPILEGDGSGFDAFGVTRPAVLIEPDGTWVLYYNGIPAANNVFGQGIGRATADSPTGTWTRGDDPILEAGSSGTWDSRFIFPDSVLQPDDEYIMYYSSAWRLGRATSPDGIVWTKYDDPITTDSRFAESDPVLPLGDPGTWDTAIAWTGSVRATDDGYEMFYTGADSAQGGSNIDIGYATSEDGIVWSKAPDQVIDYLNDQAFFPSAAVDDDEQYYLYYAVTPSGVYTEFHLATSPAPA
jgi:predicted GH43/DUF377 family glycosyl hydrolase